MYKIVFHINLTKYIYIFYLYKYRKLKKYLKIRSEKGCQTPLFSPAVYFPNNWQDERCLSSRRGCHGNGFLFSNSNLFFQSGSELDDDDDDDDGG